ncbi:MAG: hypothetical protein ACRD82_15635 [Blastocatellia bacterium]
MALMGIRGSLISVEADLAEAYNSAPPQEQSRVRAVLRSELRLVSKPTAPRLSKKESELFLKINRGLSEKQWQRMTELNEKIEEAIITEEEQAELLRLAKRSERLQVERLRAVIELAKLRQVEPEEMMRQLELD